MHNCKLANGVELTRHVTVSILNEIRALKNKRLLVGKLTTKRISPGEWS